MYFVVMIGTLDRHHAAAEAQIESMHVYFMHRAYQGMFVSLIHLSLVSYCREERGRIWS